MNMTLTVELRYDQERHPSYYSGTKPIKVVFQDNEGAEKTTLIINGDFIFMESDYIEDRVPNRHGDAITCYPCWCHRFERDLKGIGIETKHFIQNPNILRDFLKLHEKCTQTEYANKAK